MKYVFAHSDRAVILLSLILVALAQAQTTSGAKNSSGEAEESIGGAELVAIGVCSLIVLAFCTVCFVMVRNAKKRKQLAREQLDGGPKVRVGTHTMSETQIRNDQSFSQTHAVASRNLANARTGSETHVYESSEYDSEDNDRVDSFSQYGNRQNRRVLERTPPPQVSVSPDKSTSNIPITPHYTEEPTAHMGGLGKIPSPIPYDLASQSSAITIPENANFLEDQVINNRVNARLRGSVEDGVPTIDDTISVHSAAKSVQYQKVGLASSSGMFYNPQFNNTSNSINGNRGKGTRFKAKVDQFMEPIGETAGDAQDEYEASKARQSGI